MAVSVCYRLCLTLVLLLFVYTVVIHHYVYLLTLVAIHISYVYLEKKYRQLLPVNKKDVIITGCDTGFGHHLANRLADNDFIVFAGVLHTNGDGAENLRGRGLSNLHVVQLNVTKEDEIQEAVRKVKSTLKSEVLWGVVNNAGLEIPGDIELCKLSQYKRCHDINLYGQFAVIKAFLPRIRQSKGRIVNTSSVRGRFAWPGGSVYHISKYGVETMSDSLRLEMKKFGVKVSIVQPGWFGGATSISSEANCKRVGAECAEQLESASEEVKQAYSETYCYLPHEGYVYQCNHLSRTACSPDTVLDAMEDALLNVKPNDRYLVAGGGGLCDPYAETGSYYIFKGLTGNLLVTKHSYSFTVIPPIH